MKKVIKFENANISINPMRLKSARLSRGYSMTELADEIDVTRQAISNYELDKSKIGYEKLIMASKALDFPFEYFLKDKMEPISKSNIFFRSPNLAKKYVDIYEQKINMIVEIFKELEKYINFPKVNLVEHEFHYLQDRDMVDLDPNAKNEIEKTTLKLREHWGLGLGPINNMVTLLSKNGFIISRIELPNKKTDGFSQWIDGVPYIILGDSKKSSVRARFSLAHELGHMILHSSIDSTENNHKLMEKEADYFASSFLLPAESFSDDLFSINIDNFIPLKKKWKVSIASMIVRSYQLDNISEIQYSNLYRYLNKRGWRIDEPLDDVLEFEEPRIFKEALELIFDEEVETAENFLSNICMYPREIEDLVFLPDGFFGGYIHEEARANLKLIK